jgi:hypothetical protein
VNVRYLVVALAVAALPRVAAAQAASNPVADAFRINEQRSARILTAAAEEMPADKYGYKPTPAQMSFADIVIHLSKGNDYLCGTIAGTPAPQRDSVAATDTKEKLVARLKETFEFCGTALAKLDDSKLGAQVSLFGPNKYSIAQAIMITVGDWADHYSQWAIYLRLNGLLPPTAKKDN